MQLTGTKEKNRDFNEVPRDMAKKNGENTIRIYVKRIRIIAARLYLRNQNQLIKIFRNS